MRQNDSQTAFRRLSRRHIAGFTALAAVFLLGACSVQSGSVQTAPPPARATTQAVAAPTPPPSSAQAVSSVPVFSYKVVKSYPHDPNAFTQGLIFHKGRFLESTGLNGRSSLRRVEIETGKALKKMDVPRQYFAEGMTVFKDRIYQLTWQSQKGFLYDLETFQKTGEFRYEGEGWGLTHDGKALILSDGTNRLRFLDPATFKVLRTIAVYHEGRPVSELNELEYIEGEIYANIWQTDYIARIDPRTGALNGLIDLTGLLPLSERAAQTDVLNGIAYDSTKGRLFVTGKLWPKVYEIEIVKR